MIHKRQQTVKIQFKST